MPAAAPRPKAQRCEPGRIGPDRPTPPRGAVRYVSRAIGRTPGLPPLRAAASAIGDRGRAPHHRPEGALRTATREATTVQTTDVPTAGHR
ncbi:hypothetical protein GCM10018791_72670 [Streptomyces zaomyceticus]|nr:hypothetical protein GCM10018791_72670 [Streptomyces zaomyceticus]